MKQNYTWTTTEIARLKVHFPIMTQAKLEREFYPHPIRSILKVAHGLGLRRISRLNGRRDWLAIARDHTPVFALSVDLPQSSVAKRPWS